MDPERWQKVCEMYAAARRHTGAERAEFLDQSCNGDAGLRAEVESLLANEESDPEAIGSCMRSRWPELRSSASRIVSQATRPRRIGDYKILETLGEGGMGVVYLAEQERPVRRLVAIKALKRGMDTGQIVARFEAERQALAMMDHAHVARVFDSGVTDDGRPFFVMEHVPGTPITEYCDANRASTLERIGLFLRVCDAVQHAHQNGIIHRDIKPSNVLVTLQDGKPFPKVIDFGVAKAIKQRLTDRTLHTEHGQLIGTPEYMSPEQAELTGLNVDTRTDIYALGVLLYELLVGALPFDSRRMREAPFTDVQRMIREQDPPRPSTRVNRLPQPDSADAAQRRRTEPRALARQLRGDLDWITMKAMEKDRTRRYASASEMAADLRRHLANEPVLAGPPGAGYRLRKFVNRHRVGVAAAAAIVFLFLAGSVGVTWQAVIATRARAEAARERDAAVAARAEAERESGIRQRMLAFFVDDLSRRADPTITPEDVSVRDWLRDREAQMHEAFADEPDVLARVGQTIGSAMWDLGEFERGEANMTRYLADRLKAHGREAPHEPAPVRAAGSAQQFNLDRIETYYRQTIESQTLPRDNPQMLQAWESLANILFAQGKFKEAGDIYRENLDACRRTFGEDHRETLGAMYHLCMSLHQEGRNDEAEPLLLRTIDGARRLIGPQSAPVFDAVNLLGSVQSALGRMEDAEQTTRAALDGRRIALPPNHPKTLETVGQLAQILEARGKAPEAELYYRLRADASIGALGQNHADTLRAREALAVLLESENKLAECEALLVQCVQGYRQALGDGHAYTRSAAERLAGLLERQGRAEDAAPYRTLLASADAATGDADAGSADAAPDSGPEAARPN